MADEPVYSSSHLCVFSTHLELGWVVVTLDTQCLLDLLLKIIIFQDIQPGLLAKLSAIHYFNFSIQNNLIPMPSYWVTTSFKKVNLLTPLCKTLAKISIVILAA